MKVLAVIAAVLGALVVAYMLAYPTYTFRYRLTLEVEVDGNVYSGSRVVEVSEYVPLSLSSRHAAQVRGQVVGEALAIEVGKDRVLVALLEGVTEEARWGGRHGREWLGPSPAILLSRLHGVSYDWQGARNPGLQNLQRKRGVKELTSLQLPTLVSFRDVTDPSSMYVVDPQELSRTFGLGSRIGRATIEITDSSITTGIERKLPWLSTTSGSVGRKGNCTRDDFMRPELPFCPHRDQFIRSE